MSDKQVIQEILAGNSAAFRALVEKYQEMVFRTAMGFVHSKEDAEDITQDVFIQVFSSLKSFQGKSEFTTWLYRITLNISINFVNKNRFRKFLVSMEETFSGMFQRGSDEQNAQQQMESKERDAAVRKAIDSLNEKQRTAFVLSRYDDLPQREIAEIMETTEGAVEQLLQRAKANLQKKLKNLS